MVGADIQEFKKNGPQIDNSQGWFFLARQQDKITYIHLCLGIHFESKKCVYTYIYIYILLKNAPFCSQKQHES